VAQCIVIGPVCGCVCLQGVSGVYTNLANTPTDRTDYNTLCHS